MGCLETSIVLAYHIQEMRIVDDNGERETGFGTNVFRELTGGRFRHGPAQRPHALVVRESEPGYGNDLRRRDQRPRTESGRCDCHISSCLVAAVRSCDRRRRAAFKSQKSGVRPASISSSSRWATPWPPLSPGYRPRDEDVYIMHNKPGCMLARFALRRRPDPISLRLRRQCRWHHINP